MSHFAQVINRLVVQVIVAEQDFIDLLPNSSNWIQTSVNTRGGIHYGQDGKPDGGIALRGNYAMIGGVYDAQNDVFYSPQPFPSWTISAPDWTWTPPVSFPTDGKAYDWDEITKSWVINNSPESV